MERDINKICGRDCRFDKVKDFQEVEDGLSVSLSDALKTGVVKESPASLDANNIDDPDSIIGVVKDRFDAIEAERAIRKYGKKANVSLPSSDPAPSPAAKSE